MTITVRMGLGVWPKNIHNLGIQSAPEPHNWIKHLLSPLYTQDKQLTVHNTEMPVKRLLSPLEPIM